MVFYLRPWLHILKRCCIKIGSLGYVEFFSNRKVLSNGILPFHLRLYRMYILTLNIMATYLSIWVSIPVQCCDNVSTGTRHLPNLFRFWDSLFIGLSKRCIEYPLYPLFLKCNRNLVLLFSIKFAYIKTQRSKDTDNFLVTVW
jgi:hypothetical protein